MTIIIAWILWILIWGLAGYFTVRAIKMHIEKRRMEKMMAAYYNQQMLLMRLAGRYNNSDLGSELYSVSDKGDV
jgi:membrane protein DedA with SNARE-associated domain